MNPFKVFSLNFVRNKRIYLINLLGLIPSIACFIIISFWIINEVGTNRKFPDYKNIVTIQGEHKPNIIFGGCPPAAGPAFKEELPEVNDYTRLTTDLNTLTYRDDI